MTPGDASEGALDSLISIEPWMEVTDGWQTTISQTLIHPSDERAPERCDGACPTDKVTIDTSHIYVEGMAGESGNVRELSAVEERITSAW